MKYLTMLLSARPYLELAWRMYKRLQGAENRDALYSKLKDALGDGRVTPQEWSEIGVALGVFYNNNWEK